jgi:GH15 family glucan-1,4-alpha-glucosidase
MPNRIEDYAIIGNCETAALVGRDGSIDWLGMPRFDSAACFAALLGYPRHGRWLIAPASAEARVTRHYRDRTLILETIFETDDGAVALIDFMTGRPERPSVVRVVRGLRGSVAMRVELLVRFDYGSVVPWVSRQDDDRLQFTSGPDRLLLDTTLHLHGEDKRHTSAFTISAGQEIGFTLSWTRSWEPAPERRRAADLLDQTERRWRDWTAPFKPAGEWTDAVLRSAITLKALAHRDTGGIVAACTTSLPEQIGGPRNWDYRYCWLRDATFTLYALLNAGFLEEARAWQAWLVRAAAGNPDDLQIMYGVGGERRLTEYELPWLPGYEDSHPVRVGNAAAGQVQLDVYGETLDALYLARRAGLAGNRATWDLERALIGHLETIWNEPDDGIWEVRGGRRHFTHSKVMAWVAFDRAIRSVEEFGLNGPVEHWRGIRAAIHQEVCTRGFDTERNSFVQSFGDTALDASLLLIPMVGFLPADDPRVKGTVAAIERELLRDGFVLRYDSGSGADGLPAGEGAFLACSFWLVDNYLLQGRERDARTLFERLLSLRNDVGLLAEEYDPVARRHLGNFPQAFSHLALINSAHNFASLSGPARQRARAGRTSQRNHRDRGAR